MIGGKYSNNTLGMFLFGTDSHLNPKTTPEIKNHSNLVNDLFTNFTYCLNILVLRVLFLLYACCIVYCLRYTSLLSLSKQHDPNQFEMHNGHCMQAMYPDRRLLVMTSNDSNRSFNGRCFLPWFHVKLYA